MSIYLFQFNPLLAQFTFVTAIIFFIVVVPLLGSRFSTVRDQSQYFIQELTLLPDGAVEIDNTLFEMHANSRVGIFGCWLCLVDNHENKTKTTRLFLMKSSMTECHYAQLCRKIKRNTFDASVV